MSKNKLSLSVLLMLFSFFASSAKCQVWEEIAPMHYARQECSAVALNDGRILVAGGNDGSQSLNSSELYDHLTNTWKVTGPMHDARWRFSMILLKDGRVFAAGGLTDLGSATLSSCEIFDPVTESWSLATPMFERRENFPMFQLQNGKVFINGGLDGNTATYLTSTELYDPATNSHQSLSPMLIQYFGQASLYDSLNEKIIIQSGSNGGLSGNYPPTTQIYDIATDTWSRGVDSYSSHDNSSFLDMPDGSLLCLGGRISSYVAHDQIEVLRPPYEHWEKLGKLTSPRWHSSILNVGQDSALVIGGNDDPGQYTTSYDSTNWFDYRHNRTYEGPRLNEARYFFSAVLLRLPDPEFPCHHDEIAYVFGGKSTTPQILKSSERLVIGFKASYFPIFPNEHNITARRAPQCTAIDTIITFQFKGCGVAELDSIKSSSNGIHAAATFGLPFSLSSALNTPFHFRISSDGTDTTTLLKFYWRTGAGFPISYLRMNIPSYSGSENSNLTSNSPVVTGSICDGADGTFTITAPSCDPLVIDSIQYLTRPNDSVNVTIPDANLSNTIDPLSHVDYRIFVSSSSAQHVSESIKVFYVLRGVKRDTTIPVSIVFAKNLLGYDTISLQNQKGMPGDTVSLPVRLTDRTSQQISKLRLRLKFDPLLLQIVKPNLAGSSASQSTWDSLYLEDSGATLFIDVKTTLNTTANFLTLRFIVLPRLHDCTSVAIKGLTFNLGQPDSQWCVPVNDNTQAQICRTVLQVTERKNAANLDLGYLSYQNSNLVFHNFNFSQTPHFLLYDILGRTIPVEPISLSASKVTLYCGRLLPGAYVISVSTDRGIIAKKFVVDK